MATPSAISMAKTQPPQRDDTAWQERLRREAEQWRLRQSELDTQVSGYAQRESVLNTRESELWSRSEQLRQREVDLMSQESAVIHIREDYAAKQQEVSHLLEENHARQLEIEKRDTEYQTLESEYRQYAEQARQQLEHSQQQAETATEAVQRMRDQFAALNRQLEEFSQQQQELELSRNQALDAQADSEAKQRLAEQRVAEISTELDAARSEVEREQRENNERQQANEQLQQANEQLRHANERVQQANENLQHQVAELQQRVDEASAEAAQLRTDYEGALASVRQLQLLIDETKAKEHGDRQSWLAETEELRRTVEQVSVDLARANAELSEIREANDALSRQLAESEQQRLAAQAEIQSRPSNEAVDALNQELESANTRLAEMQREHEDALAKLSEQRKADQQRAEQLLSEQRAADRLEAERRVAEALAARAAENIAAGIDQPAAESDDTSIAHVDADDSALTSFAAYAVADSAVVIGDFTSTDESQQVSEIAEDDSDVADDQDEEGWPTYESEPPAGQDLLTETDSDSVDASGYQPDLAADADSIVTETAEPSSTWDGVPDESATIDAEADDEVGAEQSVTAQTGDQSNDDDSGWQRMESPQAVESRSHLESWGPESELDVQAEIDAQDGVAHWQDESPEVSVNEMIDDIEQSVEQVITDSDAVSPAAAEESVDDAEPSSAAWSNTPERDEDFSGDQSVATGWNEQLHNWESNDPKVEADAKEQTPESAASLAEQWDNSDSLASDIEFEHEATRSEQGDSEYASDPESSADQDLPGAPAAEMETTDHWLESSTEADQPAGEVDRHPSHEVDEVNGNSLAEMLIRDLDANDSHADEESADNPENTFVMSEFSAAELTDDYEATQAWDQSTFETFDAATESTLSESPADETISEDDRCHSDDEADDESSEDAFEQQDEEVVAEASGNDSIEDYMNRLLQRVQRDDDRSEMAETSTLTSSSLHDPDNLASGEPGEVAEPIDVNAPLIPRSKAPERSQDLSAMRELANSSARSAVAHSVRIQARDTQLKGIMKLIQAGVALACALACYFFLNWGFVIKSMAIIAILVIAGIIAQEAFVRLSDARRRLRIADNASDDESDFYEPVVGLDEPLGESVGSDPQELQAESFEEISDQAAPHQLDHPDKH
jgi:hypothetical protein